MVSGKEAGCSKGALKAVSPLVWSRVPYSRPSACQTKSKNWSLSHSRFSNKPLHSLAAQTNRHLLSLWFHEFAFWAWFELGASLGLSRLAPPSKVCCYMGWRRLGVGSKMASPHSPESLILQQASPGSFIWQQAWFQRREWKCTRPLEARLRTGSTSLPSLSVDQGKPQLQPRFREWENGLHLLVGGAA